MALRTRKGPFTATQAGVRVATHNRVVGAVRKAIRRRMKKNPELTQVVAAQKLGISRQQMSRWMNNPGNWTLDTVADLIHAFDLQIEELRIVLDEDLRVSNYVNPMSQQARTVVPAQSGTTFTAIMPRTTFLKPITSGQTGAFKGLPTASVTTREPVAA
jgi:DNA-binding phage protein